VLEELLLVSSATPAADAAVTPGSAVSSSWMRLRMSARSSKPYPLSAGSTSKV
jgi:hypothetical protein